MPPDTRKPETLRQILRENMEIADQIEEVIGSVQPSARSAFDEPLFDRDLVLNAVRFRAFERNIADRGGTVKSGLHHRRRQYADAADRLAT